MNRVYALECSKQEFFGGLNESVTPEIITKSSIYTLMMQLKGNKFASTPVKPTSERSARQAGMSVIKFAFLDYGENMPEYGLVFDSEGMVRDHQPNFYVVTQHSGLDPTYHVFNGGYIKGIVEEKRREVAMLFGVMPLQDAA